jgi:hypothetical protein
MIAARRGSARGPGSQLTIHSSTGSSMNGIAKTAAPPSRSTATTSEARGRRSTTTPPSQ